MKTSTIRGFRYLLPLVLLALAVLVGAKLLGPLESGINHVAGWPWWLVLVPVWGPAAGLGLSYLGLRLAGRRVSWEW